MNLGSDIRIKGSFFGHYKTLKLAKLAGWEAAIRLQQLWFFASDNRPYGNLTGMDDDDIALASGWMHETKTFVDALLSCGWLDGEPGARRLHDYEEHQPWVQERVQRAVRGAEGGKKAAERMTDEQRRERASKAGAARWSTNQTLSECLDDAKGTKHPVSTDAKRPKHTMLSPNQTNTNPIPDPDQDQEQENNAGATAGTSPALFDDEIEPKAPQKREPKPKAAINRSITFDPATFTLSGITDNDRAQWEGYAPGCNISAEIAAFLDHMQTHPESLERTTKSGAWKAALNTWFRNAPKFGQARGASQNRAQNKTPGAFRFSPPTEDQGPTPKQPQTWDREQIEREANEMYERMRKHHGADPLEA